MNERMDGNGCSRNDNRKDSAQHSVNVVGFGKEKGRRERAAQIELLKRGVISAYA